jgi:hypothetical protein
VMAVYGIRIGAWHLYGSVPGIGADRCLAFVLTYLYFDIPR